jgi:hypothetical protein
MSYVVSVLIQKREDRYNPSDLLQHWKNGTDYIFLDSKDDVDELASFLKANETDGAKSVHFFFPNDLDTDSQRSNHIAINVSGFSDGFGAFQIRCAHLNRLLATSDCLVILDGFYIDGPHLIYFACHHMAVVFCPITKFAAGHKSSANLYFIIPV